MLLLDSTIEKHNEDTPHPTSPQTGGVYEEGDISGVYGWGDVGNSSLLDLMHNNEEEHSAYLQQEPRTSPQKRGAFGGGGGLEKAVHFYQKERDDALAVYNALITEDGTIKKKQPYDEVSWVVTPLQVRLAEAPPTQSPETPHPTSENKAGVVPGEGRAAEGEALIPLTLKDIDRVSMSKNTSSSYHRECRGTSISAGAMGYDDSIRVWFCQTCKRTLNSPL